MSNGVHVRLSRGTAVSEDAVPRHAAPLSFVRSNTSLSGAVPVTGVAPQRGAASSACADSDDEAVGDHGGPVRGPSTSRGPCSVTVRRRRGSGSFGTNDHQFLVSVVRTQKCSLAQPGHSGEQDRPQRYVRPCADGRFQAAPGQQTHCRIGIAQLRVHHEENAAPAAELRGRLRIPGPRPPARRVRRPRHGGRPAWEPQSQGPACRAGYRAPGHSNACQRRRAGRYGVR